MIPDEIPTKLQSSHIMPFFPLCFIEKKANCKVILCERQFYCILEDLSRLQSSIIMFTLLFIYTVHVVVMAYIPQ